MSNIPPEDDVILACLVICNKCNKTFDSDTLEEMKRFTSWRCECGNMQVVKITKASGAVRTQDLSMSDYWEEENGIGNNLRLIDEENEIAAIEEEMGGSRGI